MHKQPLLVELYVKPGCQFCDKATQLINRYHLPHNIYMIGEDVTREVVVEQFPGVNIIPIVLINGKLLGNYPQFLSWVATTDFSKMESTE